MRVAVLGAGGHIGAAICHHLAERATVTAVVRDDRDRPNLSGLKLDFLYTDLDQTDFNSWLPEHDVVYDAAAPYPMDLGTPSATLKRSFARYERLLNTVVDHQLEYSYVSSFVNLPRRYSQVRALLDHTLTKSHPYYITKQRIEAMVNRARTRNPNIQVFCPSACIGPWDPKPPESNLIRQIAAGNFPLVPQHSINVIDVRDVARVMVDKRANVNDATPLPIFGHTLSIADFVKAVGALIDHAAPTPVPVSTKLTKASALGAEILGTSFARPNHLGLLALLALENYEVDPPPLSCARITLHDSIVCAIN